MKRNNRRCGDFPWKNKWHLKQNAKEPKYFCEKCFKLFRTGKFSRFDSKIYEDVCPNCGAVGVNLEELLEEK